MTRFAFLPSLLLITACGGQSNEEALQDAANQSDPVAAAVLNNAAERGVDPQQALEAAGRAQVANGAAEPPRQPVQARPNTAQRANPAQPGQPPEKVVVPTNETNHSGH